MGELKSEFREMIARMAVGCPDFEGLTETLATTEPSVSVRLNRRKSPSGGDMPAEIAAVVKCGVPWCGEGFYLSSRPRFTFDPSLHQGRYYVQDASSMVAAEVVSRIVEREGWGDVPLCCLDSCAAPGGKTTAIMSRLPQGSLTVANEYDFRRAEILRENIVKWGEPSVVVSRGDTARFRRLKGMFDIVAADVPCSGEGMMRKDETAVEQWSPGLVEECAARQREIVSNLWGALKPGGYLVYSTCTFNRRENEEVVEWIAGELGGEPVDMSFPEEWGVSRGVDTPFPVSRFLPNRIEGEGLFMAVLRKPGTWEPTVEAPAAKEKRKGKPSQQKPVADVASAARWIEGDFLLETAGDEVYAIPTRWKRTLGKLIEELDVVSRCLKVATVKGRDLIPAHALAMSTILAPGAFPAVEVGKETTLEYLRREAVTLPEGTPKGYVALTFDGIPLGFVKNLGNRSNNLYPQNWRILSRQ